MLEPGSSLAIHAPPRSLVRTRQAKKNRLLDPWLNKCLCYWENICTDTNCIPMLCKEDNFPSFWLTAGHCILVDHSNCNKDVPYMAWILTYLQAPSHPIAPRL
ncbi:hypothetical protein V3481_009855 [Fusarium oxysporum f. sp. vasinfectum]